MYMNLILPQNLKDFHYQSTSVVVHPCAKFSYKELRSEQWIELINTLINKGENIVLISGKLKKRLS